jgi:hypothetical protein
MSLFSFLHSISKFQVGETVAGELLQEGLNIASNLTQDASHKETLKTLGVKLGQDVSFANTTLTSLGKLLADVGVLFQAGSAVIGTASVESSVSAKNASKNAQEDASDSSSSPFVSAGDVDSPMGLQKASSPVSPT